jgi:hypothetical protein
LLANFFERSVTKVKVCRRLKCGRASTGYRFYAFWFFLGMAGMVAVIVGENPRIVKTRLFAPCFGITFQSTAYPIVQIFWI